MIERNIYLEGVDPVSMYGVNNVKFEIIKKQFPKIKLIARGNEIKAVGEESEIDRFVDVVDACIDYIHKYNDLPKEKMEEIFSDDYSDVLPEAMEDEDFIIYGNNGQRITARSINQLQLVKDYAENDLVLAIGPAGSGKTYTAIALAVKSLRFKEVKKIILTRPAVEAGENLGFLPGDYKEKLDPYLQPLYDALNDMIPSKKLKAYMEDGTIQIAPLAYMRGRTLDNATVILDEAQNATLNQFKMFLTRMGKNSKFIVTGDITQIDLPKKANSGLLQGIEILKNIKGISIIHFDLRDIVRHRLVKHIVNAYNTLKKDEENNNKTK
ncbi:MAG: PhoH family protein [Bacteroidales bacterium]|nr:PhoH family protein [Bacteroidales bacterium]